MHWMVNRAKKYRSRSRSRCGLYIDFYSALSLFFFYGKYFSEVRSRHDSGSVDEWGQIYEYQVQSQNRSRSIVTRSIITFISHMHAFLTLFLQAQVEKSNCLIDLKIMIGVRHEIRCRLSRDLYLDQIDVLENCFGHVIMFRSSSQIKSNILYGS